MSAAGGTAFNGGGPMGAAAAVTLDSFQQQQQQDSDCAIVAGEEDEVMEVTPEVHRDFFTGKHFLLTGNDDRDRSDEGTYDKTYSLLLDAQALQWSLIFLTDAFTTGFIFVQYLRGF